MPDDLDIYNEDDSFQRGDNDEDEDDDDDDHGYSDPSADIEYHMAMHHWMFSNGP